MSYYGHPLANPGKLARLTAEHDAVETPYDRSKWQPEYHDYLAPGSDHRDGGSAKP